MIFRTYIPLGGNTQVQLPALTVTHDGRTATLPQCASAAPARTRKIAAVTGLPPVTAMTKAGDGPGVRPASCTADCTDPTLQYFSPSAAAQAGLFPNPVNGISR